MIYLVQKSYGEYEDWRSEVMCYSLDKDAAQTYADRLLAEARKQGEKRNKILQKMSDLENDGGEYRYDLWEKADKVRSKLDKNLDPYYLDSVTYSVCEVEELK